MVTTDRLQSIADFSHLINAMPEAGADAADAARAREAMLTKPAGSLGRLEDIACWLSAWQARHPPRVERIQVLVFAGNHGAAALGVSAYPAEVTAQMVANFDRGGAAINQLSATLGAELSVVPLALDVPTEDFTAGPAMSEADCLEALAAGMAAVGDGFDLLCLGEMGIGNTTAAAALAAGLFGGEAADWAGPGTGVDAEGLARKRDVIDAALALHRSESGDPLAALCRLGGRELAAIAGATLAARHARVPVLLDGFVCTSAASVLHAVRPRALDHCLVAHVSAEPGHRRLVQALDKEPLLDLGMRLGEASGAALAALIVRAAANVHGGMATFAEAGVSGPAD